MWRSLAIASAVLLGRAAWADECVVPDLVVYDFPDQLRSPADLSLARAQQTILNSADGKRFALLEGADCRVRDIDLGAPPGGLSQLFTVPGGRTLFHDGKWALATPGEALRRIDAPDDADKTLPPILSNEGRHVAWIVRDPGGTLRFLYGRGTFYVPRVRVRAIDATSAANDVIVSLPVDTIANVEQPLVPRLLALDMTKRELTLVIEGAPRRASYLAVGLDGTERWGPIAGGDVVSAGDVLAFRRVGDGWVGWHSMAVSWSLPAGRGQHRVKTPSAPGQHPAIDGIALSPDQKYLAVSVGLHTRMLLSKARVYVVRVRDGKVVFDQKLHGANGSAVAFLGNDRFCYSKYDEKKQQHATHVVKIVP